MGFPFRSAADVMKPIQMPEPPAPPARAIYDRLAEWVSEEKKTLQPNQELLISCLLPGGGRITVRAFGYVGASLLKVQGSDENGQPIKTLIHHSSLCLTFTVVPKEPNKPRREIGFSGDIDEKPIQAP